MAKDNDRLTIRITMLVDLLGLLAAFYLAIMVRGSILVKWYMPTEYGNALLLLLLTVIALSSVSSTNQNILKRGYFEEALAVVKFIIKLCLVFLTYIFLLQKGLIYSRVFFGIFLVLSVLFIYVFRCYMKVFLLLGYRKSESSSKVLVVTLSYLAPKVLRNIRGEYDWQTTVTGVVICDLPMTGRSIEGIEVIADREDVIECVRTHVVDEVLIHLPYDYKINLEEMILEFEKMGITVHLNIDVLNNINLKNKTVQKYAGHQVVTFRTDMHNLTQGILKRCLDIVGGLVGCIFTVLFILVIGPIIKLDSKGPIFFSQIRIGKNGRRFKIYKFRSMCNDAEVRKQELAAQNEMDGPIFKINKDPRITKIGAFIRKTSLDEFPQFFNVLKGDMSLVGTRPPTEDEFLQYESRHKRRLMVKPGITGLWQVSGRNEIENFEDIVKLDLEYIDHWNLKMDIKLLCKTVGVVVLRKGSR